MSNFQKIIVNGKEVAPGELQSLPEAVQQVLADKNGNGVPDFLEGVLEHPFVKKAMEQGGYTSFKQLPPEMKDKLQGLFQKLGGVGVQTHHVGSQVGLASDFASPQPDWKQALAPEQPGLISVKAVIFATVTILSLFIFAFAVWMVLSGK